MTDVTLRRALARIGESYVEPERLDVTRMRDRALAAVSAEQRGETLAERGGSRLVERIAPHLEPALRRVKRTSANAGAVQASRAAMLSAALRTLDPYSRAVSGASRRRLRDGYFGAVSGIGARIGRRDGLIEVIHCHSGGPAALAGLRPGDRLSAVDGDPVAALDVAAVISRLRGKVASEVCLTLARSPDEDVVVRRRRFTLESLSARRLGQNLALLRMTRITRATPQEMDLSLRQLALDEPTHGLVLDLRGNKGGSMLAAASIADRFVPAGILVEAADARGRAVPGLRHRVDATGRSTGELPIVVLLDERTSSAAELLAAGLAWNDRAILLGRRSFGKREVLKLYDFPDADLTLRLAVAYLGTAGRRLSADGLEPDIESGPGPGIVETPLDQAARLIRECGDRSRSRWLARISRG